MRPGIDPKVDYAFKRLFAKEGNQPLLLALLQSVLQFPPGEQLQSLLLLNPFHERETFDDHLAVVDVKARDQRGRQYTVEVQLGLHRFLPERLLYYWSRLYQETMTAGASYELLQPTYVICFLNGIMNRDSQDQYHWQFGLQDERQPLVVLTRHLAIHVFELPKFTTAEPDLRAPVEQWLYFLRRAEQLDTEEWPASLALPEIKQAMEELIMISQSELERERYEARLRIQRDQRARELSAQMDLEEARRNALAEGHAEGRKKGVVQTIHVLQRMLKRTPTDKDELLRLSVDDLEHLARQLEHEVFGSSPEQAPPSQ